MAKPTTKVLRLRILRLLVDANGELSAGDVVIKLASRCPELTDEDMRGWRERVQNLKPDLVLRDQFLDQLQGVWRITLRGREELAKLEASQAPQGGVDKDGSLEITLSDTPERVHERLKSLLHETGIILGYHPEKECSEGPHRYDVVWREYRGARRPTRVFEVQDKGSLDGALTKLQHAQDAWGCRLFLVVTGKRDRKKAELCVRPWLAGTFHRLPDELSVLSSEEVEAFYEALDDNRELLQVLIKK